MKLAIRMIFTTLQRGGEVCGMRWDEIDREARTWSIPAHRMKNNRPHLVPLSGLALELLDEARLLAPHSTEFVFPNAKRAGIPILRHGMTQAFCRAITGLGIPRATPHDARRAGASNLTSERIGLPRFIASQVLGHAGDTGGAAAVTGHHYDLNDYLAEKRRALDAWAALLRSIVSGEDRPDNVTLLRSAAA